MKILNYAILVGLMSASGLYAATETKTAKARAAEYAKKHKKAATTKKAAHTTTTHKAVAKR